MQVDVLPPLVAGAQLGEQMIEVGPGPGAATGWPRDKVTPLVAAESDQQAADVLADRCAGTNVEVVNCDGTDPSFADGTFDAAGSFTMLHHVPTAALHNGLLAELPRVLRPSGVLIGSDSIASDELHQP